MRARIVLPLSSGEATLASAGGKGTNLALLARAGFEVPPGFIVTTAAYRAFVEGNGIGPRVLELAGAAPADDPAVLEAASEEIRALFTGGVVSTGISEEILEAYAGMSSEIDGQCRVAVRSSATAEDLPGLSFAGQQDTYLNIVGPEALLRAVKSCWGSLWTARAMGYRARNGISAEDVALAVVVQEMVESEVSGVLFTANPLSGHRGEIVIDASYGLGEAIASGQVEPDHYVVYRQEMRIVARRLGAKALEVVPRPEGGTETVSHGTRDQQALADAQVLDLARTAGRVADLYGAPQDIEWAWAGGRLYLLQSRPITSLYPVPGTLLQSGDLRVLFSLNSIQGVVQPFTPLGRDMFPRMIAGILRRIGVRLPVRGIAIPAGGRLFVDVTVPVTDRRLRKLILGVLAVGDPGARDIVMGLIESGRVRTSSIVSRRDILRLIFRLRPVLARMPATWLFPSAMRRRAVKKADRYVERMQQAIKTAPSLGALLAIIDSVVPGFLARLVFGAIAPALAPGMISQKIVDQWLVAWAGAEPGTMRRLLRGLPGNPTTEMDLNLWAAARSIRSDPASMAVFRSKPAEAIALAYQAGELPEAAQQAIKGFLDRYGMRAVGEIDLGRPRWREDPRSIIQSLSSYLQINDPDLAPDHQFQAAGAEAEEMAARFVTEVRKKKGLIRARLLRAAIRRMRLLSGMREMPKFYMIKLLDSFRDAFFVSGRELVAQGMLARPEDIFFIPMDILRSFAKGEPADLKSIVNHERAEYETELARRQIPRVLLSTGEAFYQGVSHAGEDDLVGDGVSPGTVEGRVRVVHDPRGVRLEPGEILVCPATDPGWTPLFLSAGGLVMELGGMITHGSVVAREYGIPAVAGVHEATRRLKTGQLVRVDGSAGRVIMLEPELVQEKRRNT